MIAILDSERGVGKKIGRAYWAGGRSGRCRFCQTMERKRLASRVSFILIFIGSMFLLDAIKWCLSARLAKRKQWRLVIMLFMGAQVIGWRGLFLGACFPPAGTPGCLSSPSLPWRYFAANPQPRKTVITGEEAEETPNVQRRTANNEFRSKCLHSTLDVGR
jgi:hypothetical protein